MEEMVDSADVVYFMHWATNSPRSGSTLQHRQIDFTYWPIPGVPPCGDRGSAVRQAGVTTRDNMYSSATCARWASVKSHNQFQGVLSE